MLHDPLLKSSKHPVDAMLCNTKVEHRSTVGRVLLYIACQLKHDSPWPQNHD
jgi:hypothetical protein